ncbi:MAG: hypothetical protein ACI4QU_04430, partial [Christensenellales bacterium]
CSALDNIASEFMTSRNSDIFGITGTFKTPTGAPQINVANNVVVSCNVTYILSNAENNYRFIGSDGIVVYADGDKVVVQIPQIGIGEIEKRVITVTGEDISFIIPDKRYNASSEIDHSKIVYSFADGVLAPSDNYVKLDITAKYGTLVDVNGSLSASNFVEGKNVGKYGYFIVTSISSLDNNYTVLFDEMNPIVRKLDEEVSILPARLVLAAEFATDRRYDGTSNVIFDESSYSRYALKFYLGDQFDGNDLDKLAVFFRFAQLQWLGKETKYVILDESGNGTLNVDVMFDSLVAYVFDHVGGNYLTKEEQESILKNYCIVMYSWDGTQYVSNEYNLSVADKTAVIVSNDDAVSEISVTTDGDGRYVLDGFNEYYQAVDELGNPIGNYAKVGSEYYPISVERYSKDENNNYVVDENGTYALVNGNYVVFATLERYVKYADYYKKGEATFLRKELALTVQNIYINDKYYDGTAVGSGGITGSEGIYAFDQDLVEVSFTVSFTQIDAGNNIKANVSINKIA